MKLYSSVIKLTNLHTLTLPRPGGQHAHAMFLDIVRAVDPSLAQRLHDLNGRKPFTVSPLMGLPKGRQNSEVFAKHLLNAMEGSKTSEFYLREGWECWLRVTILDDVLFKAFIDYFLKLPSPDGRLRSAPQGGAGGKVRLGDAHFCVSEILTTPGSHAWAGYVTLEDLQKRLDEPAPASLMLELHSPTSFNLGAENIETIPYPKLVFGNLATAWKAITGENMVKAVEKYAEKNWRPVLHRLERKSLTLHNHPQLGAVGKVEYQCLDAGDAPLARALNLLADLAFYTGLGRKTAQGMGMVRRVAG